MYSIAVECLGQDGLTKCSAKQPKSAGGHQLDILTP